MNSISVLLVDDNATFLNATAQFLEAYENMIIVGTAERGEEALTQAQNLQPKVILIDLAMPGLPGLEAIPRLKEILPHTGIIALTVMNTESFRQAALSAGADAFISKTHMRTDLIPAIQQLTITQQKQHSQETSFVSKTSQGPPGVLVIEDSAYLRLIYNKALTGAGYETHMAETIPQARQLLQDKHFDVLLCDINVGEERSTNLLREHAHTFLTSGTQVIMVSSQVQYREMCMEMGADFFMEKPVAMEALIALVNRLTARNR